MTAWRCKHEHTSRHRKSFRQRRRIQGCVFTLGWDGYPTNLGKRLWKIVHDECHGDLAEALRFLIDAHTAGWLVAGEECYCHPKRKRDPEPLGTILI